MSNPHVITWVNPTTNTDGSPFSQAECAGYQVSFDGEAAVSIPLAYGTSFDLSTLAAYQSLTTGSHKVTLSVVSTAGTVSAPSNAASFSIAATPSPATQLAIA